jgi:hypothetical protein
MIDRLFSSRSFATAGRLHLTVYIAFFLTIELNSHWTILCAFTDLCAFTESLQVFLLMRHGLLILDRL